MKKINTKKGENVTKFKNNQQNSKLIDIASYCSQEKKSIKVIKSPKIKLLIFKLVPN